MDREPLEPSHTALCREEPAASLASLASKVMLSEHSVRSGSHSTASCSCSESHFEHLSGRPVKHLIPPGALSSYAQAQRCIRNLGLDHPALQANAAFSKPSLPSHSDPASRSSKPQAAMRLPIFPCKTIATLFSHRQHRLALQAHCTNFKRQLAQEHARSNLLALPDHLLVKIICNLRHQETSPLAKVCTQMQDAVQEAIEFHFSYNTPNAHANCMQPGAPRPSKRMKAAHALHHTRSGLQPGTPAGGALQPSRPAAPRALWFQTSASKPQISSLQPSLLLDESNVLAKDLLQCSPETGQTQQHNVSHRQQQENAGPSASPKVIGTYDKPDEDSLDNSPDRLPVIV